MKWIISLLVIGISFVGFSQNHIPPVANVTINVENENQYSFSHEVEYFPQLEQRLINYSNRNRELIIELNIQDGKCIVFFTNDITDTELDETLIFLVNGLGFSSYVINEN